MAEKVQLEIEVKGGETVGQASEKVKTLKQQLREMKEELASGKLSGKEFEEMSKKAGQMQDAIGDVNQRVKNLASDTSKLDGFVDIAQGITGGFAAAQGAIALFGSENEDLQKTLVKVQGAVALLNGVQAVANVLNKDSAAMTLLNTTRLNILTAVQARYTAVVAGSTGALKALRIVGATLGIGLIVAAIALLITKFEAIKKAVTKFLPDLSMLGKFFKSVWQSITDFVGVTSDATRAADALAEATERNTKALSNEIEVMKAAGKDKEAIYKAEHKLISDQMSALAKRYRLLGELTKDESELLHDLNQQRKVLEAAHQKDVQDSLKKEQDERDKAAKDRREKAKSEAEKRKQDQLKEAADNLKYEEERLDIQGMLTIDKEREYLKKRLDLKIISQKEYDNELLKLHYKEVELEKEANDKSFAELFEQLENQRDAEFAAEQAQTARLKKEQEERVKNEKDAAAQRISITQGGLQALSDVTSAFAGKQEAGQRRAFMVNKALNVSTTLIDTYMNANKAYQSQLAIPTPDAPVRAAAAAAIATLSGLARVAAISKTQFGQGGSSSTTSGGSVPTPQISGFYTGSTSGNQSGNQNQNINISISETEIRRVTGKIDSIHRQAKVV